MKKPIVSLALAALVGVLVWQRAPLQGRYYFHRLTQAADTERAGWIEQLVALDVGVQGLAIDRLRSTETDCEQAEAVLIGLTKSWALDDPRPPALLGALLARFSSLEERGKRGALRVTAALVDGAENNKLTEPVRQRATDMLRHGVEELKLCAAVLDLAGVLAKHGSCDVNIVRELALAGLHEKEPKDRAQAVRLFLAPPLDTDASIEAVAPLLRDDAPEVRRAALLVVGSNTELVGEDDLLSLLHDEDAEVSRLCETALRSRGLQDDHLMLAKLISDTRPAARLEVLRHLGQARDLDPAVWLRRMCQDSSPAVRAAAIRAASQQPHTDLLEHVKDMEKNDPSPTIRQLAEHYLHRKR